eukprot:1022835-Amphidinium_carterae.1
MERVAKILRGLPFKGFLLPKKIRFGEPESLTTPTLVWMVLQGSPPIGALDIFCRRTCLDSSTDWQ